MSDEQTARPLRRVIDATLNVSEDVELPGGLPMGTRVANLVAILMPMVGLVAAIIYGWGWGVGWTEVCLLVGMYLITGFGITIGYHRLFAHKSFSTGPVMTGVLAILGSMAVEGSICRWVAFHRCHHQHSDGEDDPHSPHGHGTGLRGFFRGFYRAHMGWIFEDSQPLSKYIPDLQRSKLISTISALFPLWAALSMLIPTVLGGLITMSWMGALLGFIWGGLIRILVVHHITWSVNSVCHLWGTRPYKSHDESRNNPIVGVLALGEGWHNNHHAFPTSARHGLRWWQIDTSYMIIRLLERLGLVWNVRVPTAERQQDKLAA